MERHEDIMNRVLKGEKSPELEQHLQVCRQCRELAELDQWIRKNPSVHDSVPAELDQQVLTYASRKKRPAEKNTRVLYFLSRVVFPAAAAVAVCFCLFTTYTQPPGSSASHSSVSAVSKSQKTWDSMDAELLMLTCNIEEDNAWMAETTAISQGKGF